MIVRGSVRFPVTDPLTIMEAVLHRLGAAARARLAAPTNDEVTAPMPDSSAIPDPEDPRKPDQLSDLDAAGHQED